MKTRHLTLAILICSLFSITARAQGWNQDRNGIYSVGLGGTSVIDVGNGPFYLSSAGMSLNISGEYRVQRFIGVGFETGLDVFPGNYYYRDALYHSSAAIGIPIGIKVNVHILEAANVAIANRLDVYAGLNVGGGPAFYAGPQPYVYGFIQAGPQIGIRYWFNHQIAIFGEFGWGATFANIGFSF